MALALSNGEIILVIVAAVIPVAAISFAVSGDAFGSIGKGGLETSKPPPEPMMGRSQEIRQMVEAKSARRVRKGLEPLDVDAEIARLKRDTAPAAIRDRELVGEVRTMVEARNKRRVRKGMEPLDVDAEVARRLKELGEIG